MQNIGHLDMLLEKMAYKADLELVFMDTPSEADLATTKKQKIDESPADEAGAAHCADRAAAGESGASCGSEPLKINSYLLSLHSSVLAPMIDLALADSSNGSSSSGLKQLLISGTTRRDMLTVLGFVYPITPLPKVTWDYLEVLLVEGSKWDMKVPLAYAAEFIQANVSSLNITSDSKQYAFKWLQLVDHAGLEPACTACIGRIVALGPYLCTKDKLAGLSPKTLIELIDRMQQEMSAMHSRSTSSTSGYCSSCGTTRYTQKCCSTCKGFMY